MQWIIHGRAIYGLRRRPRQGEVPVRGKSCIFCAGYRHVGGCGKAGKNARYVGQAWLEQDTLTPKSPGRSPLLNERNEHKIAQVVRLFFSNSLAKQEGKTALLLAHQLIDTHCL